MNKTDFASYADDNTAYVVGNNIEDIIIKLQNASLTLFQWFYDNQMKANPDKTISFVAQMTKSTYLLKTKKYVTVHAKNF